LSGKDVGKFDGRFDGRDVGRFDGKLVGRDVGRFVGRDVGRPLGNSVGVCVGDGLSGVMVAIDVPVGVSGAVGAGVPSGGVRMYVR